jgi:lipoate-protein ligase A
MPSIGRLIPLAAGDPIANMAMDQALLESTSRSQLPTLRLYRWNRSTLSLGYFQKLSDRDAHPQSASIACVRRSTGGGAIVHHHELTYSIMMPSGHAAGPRLDLYEQVHGEVATILKDLGVAAAPYRTLKQSPPATSPFLCFQRRTPEDLIVSGYKVLGSAQRKIRGAVLQHGSLLLRASPWAPELPGIGELTSHFPDVEQLAEELTARLAARLSVDWREDSLTASEREAVAVISEGRFGSPQWHERR